MKSGLGDIKSKYEEVVKGSTSPISKGIVNAGMNFKTTGQPGKPIEKSLITDISNTIVDAGLIFKTPDPNPYKR